MRDGRQLSLAQAMAILDADHFWRRYQVDYPPGRAGRAAIEVFEIAQDSPERIQVVRDEGMARDTGYGTFRKLTETIPGAGPEGAPRGVLWMADTRCEIIEHMPVLAALAQAAPRGQARRILVNGLGLGVTARAALACPLVEHVDIVERSPDIIALVGPHLAGDARVEIHAADAHEIQWPAGTRWDLAWHDIWSAVSDAHLPGMYRLMARYENQVAWQDCWQLAGCAAMDRVMRQLAARGIPAEKFLEFLAGKTPWLP